VQEEREQRLGAALPDLPADQVEVVVVEHHQGAAAAGLDLLDHRVGELPVDGHIAVRPGGVFALGQRGGEGEAVHAVLEEPEQRVGDHRVEVVVGLLLDLDQAQVHGRRVVGGAGPVRVAEPRFGVEGDLDRLPAVLGGHGGVLLGGRGTHPDGVGQVRDQARERRDQAAGAAGGRPARLVAPERHRSPVRQQHHRQVRLPCRRRHRHPAHSRSPHSARWTATDTTGITVTTSRRSTCSPYRVLAAKPGGEGDLRDGGQAQNVHGRRLGDRRCGALCARGER
jgi:hypothetical protein